MEARSVDGSRDEGVVVFRTRDVELLARASSVLHAAGIAFRVHAEGGGHFGQPEHVFRLLVAPGSEDAARRALDNLPSEDIPLIERDRSPGPWRFIAWTYILAAAVLVSLLLVAALWAWLR